MARTVGSSGFNPTVARRACSSVSISDFLNKWHSRYRLKKQPRMSEAKSREELFRRGTAQRTDSPARNGCGNATPDDKIETPALFGDFFAGQRLNKAGNSHSFSP